MTTEQLGRASGGGQVAVVTGGASGIGRATVARLAAAGLQVAVLDLGDPATADAKLALRADVTDPAEVEEAFTAILSAFGRIDVLVNNAGITGSAAATVARSCAPVQRFRRCSPRVPAT
jgi:NAD(P)-dependent dehydrogenase (short-subunit alcohol dehydrogenase family)